MKLHFSKTWTRKFNNEENVAEYGAGTSLSKSLILSSLTDSFEYDDWEKYPLKEMVKNNWISATTKEIKDSAKIIMSSYFSNIWEGMPVNVLCKRTYHKNTTKNLDVYALTAWTARVLMRANEECCPANYKEGTVDKGFLQHIAQLSVYDDGPLRARDELANNGIALIIERHLSKTYLDGGSFLDEKNRPVIGLTLRQDRIDNFWFTLLHELSHVFMHLKTPGECFVDDTKEGDENDEKEKQANRCAREVTIPRSIWNRSKANKFRTYDAIIELAEKQGIHPAIVAGRLRHETGDYKLFSDLIKDSKVKFIFSEVDW